MFRSTFQSGVISMLSAYGTDPLQLWDIYLDDSNPEKEKNGFIRRIMDHNINPKNETESRRSDSIDDSKDERVVQGPFIEILGSSLPQNFIICPPKRDASESRPSLGITLSHLHIVIKIPSQSHFSFEVTILDDKQIIRRFRASTYQSTTVVKPDLCTFPLKLERKPRRLVRDALLLPDKQHGKFDSRDNQNKILEWGINQYNPQYTQSEDHASGSEDDMISCWNRISLPLVEYTRRAYGTKYLETMWIQIHSTCQLKRIYFTENEMNGDDMLPEEFRLYQHDKGYLS